MKQLFLHTKAFEDMLKNPRGSVPSDIYPLVEGYLTRRENEVSELVRLLNANNFDKIKFIGHRLRGSGSTYGFPVITEIGRELEDAALEKDRAKVIEFVKHLSNVVRYLKLKLVF